MQRHWKYQTNNHCYFSQTCWADRLFNINRIMCVLTFSNCLGTFRTEYFIMPLVLRCSFQKILPAWNKVYGIKSPKEDHKHACLLKKHFQCSNQIEISGRPANIHLYLYQSNFYMYQIIALIRCGWKLTKFWKGLKKVLFPTTVLLFSDVWFQRSICIKYTEKSYLRKPNEWTSLKGG